MQPPPQPQPPQTPPPQQQQTACALADSLFAQGGRDGGAAPAPMCEMSQVEVGGGNGEVGEVETI